MGDNGVVRGEWTILLLVVLVALVGCGNDEAPEVPGLIGAAPIDPATTDTAPAAGGLLGCLGVTFGPDDWEGREPLPPGDDLTIAVHETFDSETQTDLEVLYVLDGGEIDDLRVVHRDDHEALLAFEVSGEVAEDAGHVGIIFANSGDGWKIGRAGGCTPEARHPDGPRPAAWEPDGEVDPRALQIPVHVRERECAGGGPAEDRLLPPQIEADDKRVVVTWFVEPIPGVVTCPGNPTARMMLELSEPLGDRELLDGGVYPPREPTLHR